MMLGKPTSRARVLSNDELKAIWAATREQSSFSTIVRLLILCGQRPQEIAALHSDYITEGTINLPGWLCKNGRDHSFPMGPLAANLLAAIQPNSSSPVSRARKARPALQRLEQKHSRAERRARRQGSTVAA
jgi:integrase